jgi:hypothetical protein
MSAQSKGLRRDPLARANEALGLDDPPPPLPAPRPAAAPPVEPEPDDEVVEVDLDDSPDEPSVAAESRGKSKPRTGTFTKPYARQRDGKAVMKVSFNASLDFYRELRRFEANLPPRQRNVWIEKALRSAMARDEKRWESARAAKAAGQPSGDAVAEE